MNPVECTGEKVTTGGTVGQCCDGANYQATCINGGANALICSTGVVKQWTCKDNGCKPKAADPKKVDCPNPNP